MKKFVPLIIVICILLFWGGFHLYKTEFEKHYIISAVEKTLADSMKSPSSFKILEVFFFTDTDGTNPTMLVKYEAKNSYGTPIVSLASFTFAQMRIKEDSGKHAETFRKLEEHDRISVANGKILTPFENLEIVSAIVEGRKMDEISLLSLHSAIVMKKLEYSGPNLGGKIDKINDDGTVICSFKSKKYIPGDYPPYK